MLSWTEMLLYKNPGTFTGLGKLQGSVTSNSDSVTPNILTTLNVTQSEKTGLIAHVSKFDFSPRTHSYMNKLSNSMFKIS